MRKVDSKTAAAIRARIDALNDACRILLALALMLELSGHYLAAAKSQWGVAAIVLAKLFWIVGLAVYAEARGRSWLWGSLGLIGCIGYAGLGACLGKRCHACRAQVTGPSCSHCSAPTIA